MGGFILMLILRWKLEDMLPHLFRVNSVLNSFKQAYILTYIYTLHTQYTIFKLYFGTFVTHGFKYRQFSFQCKNIFATFSFSK